MIITLLNPSTDDLEKTYLSQAIAAGVTTLPVKNNDRFTTNDRIMIGEMGQEKTEIVTWSANPTNSSITVSATVYPHPADTPVYKLQWDQAKFYRSTTGVSGTYTVISTQTLDVDNANLTTIYNDTSGLAGYYYKMTVYHSLLALESSDSDPIAGAGNPRNTVGVVIDELFDEFGNDATNVITRSEMIAAMNEVNDDLHTRTKRPYDFLHTRETLDRTANLNYVAFPTDSSGNQTMWKFDRMEYNFTDTSTDPDTDTTYPLRVLPLEEFQYRNQDNTISSTTVDDTVAEITLDIAQDRFYYYPPSETTQADVFILYYWKYFTILTSDGDVLETPGTKIYKDYIRGKYYRKIGKRDGSYLNVSDRYLLDYEREVQKLQKANRKDMGTPRSLGGRGVATFKGWRN